MSDRSRSVHAAHGVAGLCRYYASIAAYIAWQRVRETSNTIRYRLARRDPLRVCLFTGRPIRLPRNDGGIGIELMSGIREPAATRYLQTFLQNDDVVLDIGANIGYYVAVERYAAPGAEIHAIEPVLANLRLLLENTSRQVKVYPLALGDHAGTAPIYIPDRCNWATMNQDHARTLSGVQEAQVQVITLDQFCEQYGVAPTFLRMDTEGSEVEIIRGARNLIESSRPLKLMIELHGSARPPGEVEGLVRYLLDQGFVIREVIAEPNIDLGEAGAALMQQWYGLLWSSIPGTDLDRLAQMLRWRFCPNVFMERA